MELTRKFDSRRIPDTLFYWFANTILFLIRSIYSFPKNKSGVILIVSFHKLGDTVFTIPAVKELVNYYKNNEVIILTFSECTPIFRIAFQGIKIVTIDKKEFQIRFKDSFIKSYQYNEENIS